jgi:peptidyl-dipeptidase Dcp
MIKAGDYQSALEIALAEARHELAAMTSARSTPTFANTIEALERMGQRYHAVAAAFFNVAGADPRPRSRPPKKRSYRCSRPSATT